MRSFLRTLVACLLLVPAAGFAGGLIDRFGAPTWEVGGKQAADLFGFSATTAGDVNGDGYGDVIVGAEFDDSTLTDEGGAFLFLGSSHGSSLTPSWAYHGRQLNAYAGTAVAPAGDVNRDGYDDVLVGVPFWDVPGHPDAGKVAVFYGGPSGLSTTPASELFSPTPADNENFGTSVAYAGDVNGDGYADVVIGSQLVAGGFSIGAAYIYVGGPTGLAATPMTTAFGFPGANSQMGASVSTAGDVNADGFADVILGSPGDSRAFSGGGAAYVLTGKASGPAELDTLLLGPAANANLGRSVSVAGDVNGDGYSDVVIGVPGFGGNAGKAMIGLGGTLGIKTVTDLGNPEAPPNEAVGVRVSTVGDINGDGFGDFAVVARYTGGTSRGRISIYYGSFNGPQYFGEILTHGSDGFFGNCIASSGDTDGDGLTEILVGTEDVSVQPGQHEGVAYQFKAPRNGIRLAIGSWPRSGAQPGSGYGSAVAAVRQLNGGDIGKLLIGDPQFGGNGRVSEHAGEQLFGVDILEERSFPAGGSFWSYGAKIADAGDIDGDSYGDFIVSGTTIDIGPASQAGRVFLQRGANGALPAQVPFAAGANSFDRMGSAVAGRGDTNADGYHDVLVGAREWDEPGKADAGKASLFFGGASGLTGVTWAHVGEVASQGFGAGLALADFDADGYTDVIAGSSSPTFGSTLPGKVEVFYGGPSGPALTAGTVYMSTPPDVSFGLTVANVGDVTGDGIADIAVGAPRENNRGVVRIYEGTLGRSQSPRPLITIVGTQDNARLGEAIAGGGDVDGDGIGDLVVGEPGWDGGQTDEGRFTLYYGPVHMPLAPGVVVESDIVGAALGASVAPFRDVNVDGFADVMVGAPGAAGRAYPYFGGGFGMRLELEAFDFATAHRTLHPARAQDPDQVEAILYTNTAGQGRSKLGYELEIKPSNQAFDGNPIKAEGPDLFDSGPAGTQPVISPVATLSPPLPGRTLKMRARWTTPNPLFPRSRWITPEAHTSGDHDLWLTGSGVGVGPGSVADALRIDAVAPNPTSGRSESVVSFTLPHRGHVALDVYDVRGARVRRLTSDALPAGRAALAWDGTDDHGRTAATGVYLIVLRSGTEVARAKLLRLP